MQGSRSAGRVNGVHHVGMSVPDLDVARAFYVDLLGLQEISSNPIGGPSLDIIADLQGTKGRMMFLATPNTFLEVFEFSTPAPDPQEPHRPVNQYGFTHIGFDVDDTDALVARLAKAGARFHSPVQSLHGVKTVYARDPFGNVVELQQVVDEGRVRRMPQPVLQSA